MSRTFQRSNKQSALSSWLAAVQADAAARELLSRSVRVLLPLAKVASLVKARELWSSSGYASLHDFTRERFERHGRWLRDHAALHQCVEGLPALRFALTGEDGGAPIGVCKGLLVGRVASVESLALWVGRARQLSLRELRGVVREEGILGGEFAVGSRAGHDADAVCREGDAAVECGAGDGASCGDVNSSWLSKCDGPRGSSRGDLDSSGPSECDAVGGASHGDVESGGLIECNDVGRTSCSDVEASGLIECDDVGHRSCCDVEASGLSERGAVIGTSLGDVESSGLSDWNSVAGTGCDDVSSSGLIDCGDVGNRGCDLVDLGELAVSVLEGADLRAHRLATDCADDDLALRDVAPSRATRPGTCTGDEHDIDEIPRVLWSIPAPQAVRAAFDSALDLYRRLEGGDATVTSFVEALVAEEFASERSPDVLQEWLRLVEPPLDPVDPPSGFERPAMTAVLEMLARLDEMIACAGEGSDDQVLQQLICFSSASDEIERTLALLLIEMSDSGALRELGFASIGAYAESRLGLPRTTIEDRVRAARALAKRPVLRRAYLHAGIGLEKALLATQILGRGYVAPECEAEWVEHLEQCTVKRLRDEKRVLLWAVAVDGRFEAPRPMSDQAWLDSLRCGPGDTIKAVQRAGRAACDNALLVPVSGSVLRLRLPVELANDFSACVESRRHYLAVDAEACDWSQPVGEDDPASWRAARTFSNASRRLPAWVGLLAMLEEFCATHDLADRRSASWSEVFVRSGHRCEAPGCTSRRVEWHHRHYKSRGGSDHDSNGDALCPTHHRHGEHGGYMRVTGDTPLRRVWRLGRADVAQWFCNERRVAKPGRGAERIE
ncbi:MAG: HNH endonuclease signature motif containing protein [Acidobacteriota bacterium]